MHYCVTGDELAASGCGEGSEVKEAGSYPVASRHPFK